MQQLVRKRLQKNNQSAIFRYILLSNYPSHFPKFFPIQKHDGTSAFLRCFFPKMTCTLTPLSDLIFTRVHHYVDV